MPVRKKRRRDQPHKVLHLTTYQRLEEYLGAFAQGHFHLLILVGAGGLAKSRSVRAELDGKACWIEGNATRQLEQVSALPGIQAVAAMPDLPRPGTFCTCRFSAAPQPRLGLDGSEPGVAGRSPSTS